ncbi:MAG TPA: AarF/UbiB family protein, partial [Myxococcota bacterium]
GLARVLASARPADRLLAAAAVHAQRPAAANALADVAVAAASLDDIGALLLAAERNPPLAPLRSLIGDRLASAHPLSAWQRFAAEPAADDVKTALTRLHGAALAIDHGKLAAPESKASTIAALWTERVRRFDLDEVETAAKVVGLAQSLAPTPRFGPAIVDETLAQMPDATLVRLALLPPSTPPERAPKVPSSFRGFGLARTASNRPYVEDPQTAIHRQAVAHIVARRPAVLTSLLAADAPAPQRREHLALALALLHGPDAQRVKTALDRQALATAAGAAVSSLLVDESTTDEPRARAGVASAATPYAPSDTSLQKLVAGASALARVLDTAVPLDVNALTPLLASRPAEELAALVDPMKPPNATGASPAWCGPAAAGAVRAELRARFAATTLEPHEALLAAAFVDAAPDRAALSSWLSARRAASPEEHGAALVAVAKAFGPSLVAGSASAADKSAIEGALSDSFGELVDDAIARGQVPGQAPFGDKQLRELFGLAQAIERSMPQDFAPKLSTLAAQKLPLDALSAPFLDDKLARTLAAALPHAHDAAAARIQALAPAEVAAFFAAAPNAATLAERLGLALRVWFRVGSYQEPMCKDARAIAETTLPAALARLAAMGDVTNADQRKLVLFAGHALRDKLASDVTLDVPAANARRFVDAAPAQDVLALCLDTANGAGLRAAAIDSVEARAQGAAPAQLHELLSAFLALSRGSSSSSSADALPADASAWHALVTDQLEALSRRPWQVLWRAVDQALDRARDVSSVAERAALVLAVLPSSREQNQALSQVLGAPPLPFAALAQIDAYQIARNDDTVLRPERRLLAHAIVAHPSGPFAVINALDGKAQTPALNVPPELAAQWQRLSADERKDVVGESFRQLFQGAYGNAFGSSSDPVIKARVEDALEREVFATLRTDPDLTKLVDRLQPIFARLPRAVQARVAAAFALAAPSTDPPTVLRRLLENAGVVAIKVAQQICEDPSVPARFRDVLESLRDQNLEVPLLDAWSVAGGGAAVRGAQESGYGALGKRLGTGSVKQANRVLSMTNAQQVPLVLAFLKPGVKEEIEQSLNALAVDPELAPVVSRVRSMLVRELDLDKEAQAFTTMAKHLAPWTSLRVPKVLANTRESLL